MEAISSISIAQTASSSRGTRTNRHRTRRQLKRRDAYLSAASTLGAQIARSCAPRSAGDGLEDHEGDFVGIDIRAGAAIFEIPTLCLFGLDRDADRRATIRDAESKFRIRARPMQPR